MSPKEWEREGKGQWDAEEMIASGHQLFIVRVAAKIATKKPYVSAKAQSCSSFLKTCEFFPQYSIGTLTCRLWKGIVPESQSYTLKMFIIHIDTLMTLHTSLI